MVSQLIFYLNNKYFTFCWKMEACMEPEITVIIIDDDLVPIQNCKTTYWPSRR